MTVRQLEVAGQRIGEGCPCFVIAEAGVNHNGRVDWAIRSIDEAVAAGANAVKFQTFKTERLVTPDAPKAEYQKRASGATESQFDMLRRLELSEADHRVLLDHCRDRGICFLSTPFDEDCADFLDELGVPAFKVPSGEITNLPYLAHVARKGKPLIVSTGMASLAEIEEAVRTVEDAGNDRFALLHCVSDYPANPAEANLRVMHTLAGAFGVPVGFSDHTEGTAVALAAAALGACIIEKHFTLDRTLPGPDHAASIEPDELRQLVHGVRTVESALGDGRKRAAPGEISTAAVARKSIVAARDIPAGSILTANLLALRRPGTGLPPAAKPYLLGRLLYCDVPAGTPLTLEMLACERLAS